MNILLIEPHYHRRYPPLGLMRISSYHKAKGDRVQYERVNSTAFLTSENEPDIIYITSTPFCWNFEIVVDVINGIKKQYPKSEVKVGGLLATLYPNEIEKATGTKPFIGLWDEVERYPPDYSLFPDLKCSISFTCKGCIRKCGFCVVSKVEPEFKIRQNWVRDIDVSKKWISFWDNNFLASPPEHIDSVLLKIRELGKAVDFNQGLDARLFTEEHAIKFTTIKWKESVRFAFDNMGEDGFIQRAIDLCHKYDFANKITVDAIYNFKDSPEDFWYRMSEILKHNAIVFPMRYQHIQSLHEKLDYKSYSNWKPNQIMAFKHLVFQVYKYGSALRGIIAPGAGMDYFYEVFGKDEKEFVKKLDEVAKKNPEDKPRMTLDLRLFG